MDAPTGLPDPDTLDVFQYYDKEVDAMIDIVSDDNTHPRVIKDYVIDPIDWSAENRGRFDYSNKSRPQTGYNTVEQVLTCNTFMLEAVCVVCGQRGLYCNGPDCVEVIKNYFQNLAAKLQIRKAEWGFGVFALEDLPKGTMIGEYLGRLLPYDAVSRVGNDYTFQIEGRAMSDADRYGNFTRFINHNCNSNTNPIRTIYGRREVICIITNRPIAAGEEVTLDYGWDYFTRRGPCECDAFPYPHTSEKYRRQVFPDRSVSATGIDARGRSGGAEQGCPPPARKSVLKCPFCAEAQRHRVRLLLNHIARVEKPGSGPGSRGRAGDASASRGRCWSCNEKLGRN